MTREQRLLDALEVALELADVPERNQDDRWSERKEWCESIVAEYHAAPDEGPGDVSKRKGPEALAERSETSGDSIVDNKVASCQPLVGPGDGELRDRLAAKRFVAFEGAEGCRSIYCEGWNAARAHAPKEDADLTTAYMVGFEKGKEAAHAPRSQGAEFERNPMGDEIFNRMTSLASRRHGTGPMNGAYKDGFEDCFTLLASRPKDEGREWNEFKIKNGEVIWRKFVPMTDQIYHVREVGDV